MSPTVTFELGGAALATAHRAALSRMYQQVFSAPPFLASGTTVEEHAATLDGYARLPGFALSLARDGHRLVGFAYGHRLPPDHRWWEGFRMDIPPDLAAEWEGRSYTLVDLAVEESHRRTGIGRRLVEALLAPRREERVLLSTQPTAEPAHAFYRATGWELVGRKGPIPDVLPPYWDIYLRRLVPPAQ